MFAHKSYANDTYSVCFCYGAAIKLYSFLFVPSLYIYLRHISDAVSIEKTVIKSRSVAAGTPNPDPTRPHYMHVCVYAQLYRGETS